MLWKAVFLSLSGLVAANATAQCTLARGKPITLVLPAQTITISADAVKDLSAPISGAEFVTSAISTNIGYDDCLAGTPAGRRLPGAGDIITTKIYKTNIEGIGVMVHLYVGSGFGYYPIDYNVSYANGESTGTFDWKAGNYFRVRFFKTSDTLSLSDPSGDIVLDAGTLGYEWIMDEATRPMTLDINQIKIISTPACTTSESKTIDFSTVTPAMLTNGGVEKPLDFGMTCKTDYGTYSAIASVTSTASSTDSRYIQVTDSSGNSDNQLGIEIYNSSGSLMTLNGNTLEKLSSVASGVAAQFNWTAKLINTGSSKTRPQNGNFTAKAEILLQLN
ncbi:fimbrial protein [Erwinia psidii]|uniref:Fimbrial protein n=1 Tax=Erwinia psidii TaxID=69224 RepID=A0A3N6S0G5_9GAMM|nr:fimbrial protein [Erwinia psidii]MCX8958680.1 fimbrial protein [Erwinia psidii]MCX8961191.1 fimbrial protein [Erwinia psidii]MCX8966837.1 fimbrial protein [Erwinia psidii]RQM38984.1 fimbrial protein [Erwinia psidii]